jgi:hypothetical protein
MKLFPWRPIRCMNRSMTKAARAMYPTSSKTARNRKKINRIGTKVRTDPTPPNTPSIRMPFSQGWAPPIQAPSDCAAEENNSSRSF